MKKVIVILIVLLLVVGMGGYGWWLKGRETPVGNIVSKESEFTSPESNTYDKEAQAESSAGFSKEYQQNLKDDPLMPIYAEAVFSGKEYIESDTFKIVDSLECETCYEIHSSIKDPEKVKLDVENWMKEQGINISETKIQLIYK